jgi:hypothetical protein
MSQDFYEFVRCTSIGLAIGLSILVPTMIVRKVMGLPVILPENLKSKRATDGECS